MGDQVCVVNAVSAAAQTVIHQLMLVHNLFPVRYVIYTKTETKHLETWVEILPHDFTSVKSNNKKLIVFFIYCFYFCFLVNHFYYILVK